MAVISNEALELHALVRDNYPKTYEWMKHKANWEHMCMGAVSEYYRKQIEAMIEEEKHNA
jgi:hypothetical protein